MIDYNNKYNNYVNLIEKKLEVYCNEIFGDLSEVGQAARYSLFSGGKRIRGVLTVAVSDLLDGDLDTAVAFACAVEMLHCYSLIHDDLPAMDNSDMRRGKASCHVKYGEAVALLAGDALLTGAFEQLTKCADQSQISDAVISLSKAAGCKGMIYGQELDISFEGKKPAESDLLNIHFNKTGQLIMSASMLGAIAGKANISQKEAICSYSEKIGMVFQIIDDILDITATDLELGKPSGNDAALMKITFATFKGIDYATLLAENLTAEAIGIIDEFGDNSEFLKTFAKIMLDRKN